MASLSPVVFITPCLSWKEAWAPWSSGETPVVSPVQRLGVWPAEWNGGLQSRLRIHWAKQAHPCLSLVRSFRTSACSFLFWGIVSSALCVRGLGFPIHGPRDGEECPRRPPGWGEG